MELKTSDQFKDQAHLIGTAGERLIEWVQNATDEEIAAVKREVEEGTTGDLREFYSNTSVDLFDETLDDLGVDVSELPEEVKQAIVQGVIETYNYGKAMMRRIREKNFEKIAPLLKNALSLPTTIARGTALHTAIEETGGIGEVVKRKATRPRSKKKAERGRKAA